jgi:hypothetical protein
LRLDTPELFDESIADLECLVIPLRQSQHICVQELDRDAIGQAGSNNLSNDLGDDAAARRYHEQTLAIRKANHSRTRSCAAACWLPVAIRLKAPIRRAVVAES